ncbi:MAG: cytidylate kinase-like family protein [Paludibacteraceae bacterium]|nr:cytidylate kinase-like family protein [Paludibacteraceae bacterium]MBR5374362.1 cytidylate kinase-like family protein [Paludibacteraceae bacterium]
MDKNIVISIGRQFGAGGRRVGQALAKELGIAYYDKELIMEAAKEFGFAPVFFEENDEKSASFAGNVLQWMESFVTNGMGSKNYLSQDTLFEMQSEVVRKVAEKHSCVIVGRCSDYVLRDYPNCVSVFLHSSDEDRIQRIRERSGLTEEEAISKMRMQDKKRAAYYNFYSSKTWGESATYTLSIDVSSIGVEQTVQLIMFYLRQRGMIE